MYRQAINLLKNLDRHILIMGEAGTGKSMLLSEVQFNNNDVKYYHFPDINEGKQTWELCDKNFDELDFLAVPEKILIFDGVAIGKNLEESKVVRFIKTARKHGKRLIVVTFPSDGVRIKPLFGVVITLSGRVNGYRACEIEILS